MESSNDEDDNENPERQLTHVDINNTENFQKLKDKANTEEHLSSKVKKSKYDDGPSPKEVGRNFVFTSSNQVKFESDDDGKIKCGKCQKKFIRIISHLKNTCQGVIPQGEMDRMQEELNKLKHNKRMRIERAKAKKDNPEKYQQSERIWREKAQSKNLKEFILNIWVKV